MRIAILAALAGATAGANAQLINEIQPNPSGADPSMVSLEIRGMAGASFDGFFYSIEADSSSAFGTIDRLSAVSGVFDANGLLTVMIADLENPSATYVLATGGTASIGDNIGMGNTGILGNVVDAIGVVDQVEDTATSFGALLGGTDIAYTGDEQGLIFRDSLDSSIIYSINEPEGTEAFDQFGNAFDLATDFFTADGMAVDLSGLSVEDIATFGGVNLTTIPAPAAATILGLGGLVATRRRR